MNCLKCVSICRVRVLITYPAAITAIHNAITNILNRMRSLYERIDDFDLSGDFFRLYKAEVVLVFDDHADWDTALEVARN